MNINVATLLHQNNILLLFVALAIGLCIAKIKIANIRLGNSIGVLIASLLLGHCGYSFPPEALSIGFMLFIYCVGIEAGPHFFSVFFRDGAHYLILTLTVILSSVGITLILSNYLDMGLGISVGMLSGALTATPVLVSAKDALYSGLFSFDNQDLGTIINDLSVGYAMAYLIGLVSLIVVAKLLPQLQKHNLHDSSKQIAKERGLDSSTRPKIYLPIIRAYRVEQELLDWIDGKNLGELGLFRQTGCHIERIRRNGILAKPNCDAILQKGDEIALVGYPKNHATLAPCFKKGKEVFDRDLLDLRIIEENIVIKNDNIAGKRLSDLNFADDYGCFLSRIVRSQIDMPLTHNIILDKGDVLQVSGEASKVLALADRLGFIAIKSQLTDLLAFCTFFIIGLILGAITVTFGQVNAGLGNAASLLIAGITLGYLRANHPTFGYIPQGALNMAKDFGLMVFMVGIGLSAGERFFASFATNGAEIMFAALIVSVVPVVISYIVGAYVLKMNRALLFGAIIGARTCAPAMDIINDYAKSSIPALGYAGTYTIANVLLTLAGTFIIMLY